MVGEKIVLNDEGRAILAARKILEEEWKETFEHYEDKYVKGSDSLGRITKQEGRRRLDVPPEDRLYIRPEDVHKLPKGIPIYRGPRGGWFVRRSELKAMLGEHYEEKLRERGIKVQRQATLAEFVLREEHDFDKLRKQIKAMKELDTELLRQAWTAITNSMAWRGELKMADVKPLSEVFKNVSSLNVDRLSIVELEDGSRIFGRGVVIDGDIVRTTDFEEVTFGDIEMAAYMFNALAIRWFADKLGIKSIPRAYLLRQGNNLYVGVAEVMGAEPVWYRFDYSKFTEDEKDSIAFCLAVKLGDMHSGNWFYVPNVGVVPIDFDFMGYEWLEEQTRTNFSECITNIDWSDVDERVKRMRDKLKQYRSEYMEWANNLIEQVRKVCDEIMVDKETQSRFLNRLEMWLIELFDMIVR